MGNRRAIRCFLAGIGIALLLLPASDERASAAGGLGLEIVAWLHSVDASPDWTARMRGLSIDEVTGVARIGELEITAERGGVAVDMRGVVLAGYAEDPAGGFTAASLQVREGRIKTAGAEIVLQNAEIENIGIPALAGVAFDRSKLFTSLVAAYSAIAKCRVGGGRIAEVAVIETFEGVASRMSYRNVSLGPLAEGVIERVSAGPLRLESPSPNPLAEMTVVRVEGSAIDLDALLHVYDPLRYIAGVGDGVWHEAAGKTRYDDIAIALPGVALSVNAVTAEGFKVRQPAESFAPLLDAMMADRRVPQRTMEALGARHTAGLASAFGVGHFAVDGVELAAVGIDQLTLDSLSVSEASSDGIGEFALEGLVGAIAGQGAVTIGRLALGDVTPAPIDRVVEALDDAERGRDVDFSSLAPKIGLFEAADINMQAIDFPGAMLGRMRADLANYVGSVPTNVAVEIDDLDIATASLKPDRAATLIASLGYDRIRVDASFGLNWQEADGTVSLDDFTLDIEDFGKATANIVLAGLTREAIERLDDPAEIVSDLLFNRARVSFEDKSVVERSLSMRADLLKIPLDRLKQQLAGALPLMLAFVGDPERVRAIVPVLQTFIKAPGTLTIEAAPTPPVPMSEIEAAARTRPQSLPGMLSISVSGTAGPGAAQEANGAGEGSPPIRKTLEPESRPGTTGSTKPIPAEPP